jgi:hypothetical protein
MNDNNTSPHRLLCQMAVIIMSTILMAASIFETIIRIISPSIAAFAKEKEDSKYESNQITNK